MQQDLFFYSVRKLSLISVVCLLTHATLRTKKEFLAKFSGRTSCDRVLELC